MAKITLKDPNDDLIIERNGVSIGVLDILSSLAIPAEGDIQIFDNPLCTGYATGVKNPGDKVYARVNVPWTEYWEVSSDFTAYANPYKIGFHNGSEFLSSESQDIYTAGQIVELTLKYYTSQDITDAPKIFTKPS